MGDDSSRLNPSSSKSRQRAAMTPRYPVTRKGQETRKKLLRVARATFEKHGFHRTSVSRICRESGVAMGTFYQYFGNKRDVFLFLAGELGEGLRRAVEAELNRPAALPDQVSGAVSAFATFIERNRAFYQIFREIEFVDRDLTLDFYDGLADSMAQWLKLKIERGEVRSVHPRVTAFALIAVAYFCSLRWIVWGEGSLPPHLAEEASRIVVQGIGLNDVSLVRSDRPIPDRVPELQQEKKLLTRGATTRRELLKAAEGCFGQKGFWATSIADLTRNAGVAQGAFYLYFRNKTEILSELVREIHMKLRRTLAGAIQLARNRIEAEQLGFLAFFRFASRHPGIYRIVREAEFVDAAVARWYYESLADVYTRRLQEAIDNSEIRPFDSECLAYSLLGIGHFLGLRWVAWSSRGEMPSEIFEAFTDLLMHGMLRR